MPATVTKPFVEQYVAGWSLRDRPASSIPLEGVDDVVLFSVLPRRTDRSTRERPDGRGRALVAIGFERRRIDLGIGPRTTREAARARATLAGGVILWGDARP